MGTKAKTVTVADNGDVDVAGDDIGGFYVDARMFSNEGSFAGTAMIADFAGDVTIIGSERGDAFWALTASDVTRGEDGAISFSVSFETEGGAYAFDGEFADGE